MRALFGLLLLAAPAWAQDLPPACTPATRGQVACMAQRLCSCGYVQGGSMTGVPSGWAWDCGAFRPDCTPPPQPFASPGFQGGVVVAPMVQPYRQPYPQPWPDDRPRTPWLQDPDRPVLPPLRDPPLRDPSLPDPRLPDPAPLTPRPLRR